SLFRIVLDKARHQKYISRSFNLVSTCQPRSTTLLFKYPAEYQHLSTLCLTSLREIIINTGTKKCKIIFGRINRIKLSQGVSEFKGRQPVCLFSTDQSKFSRDTINMQVERTYQLSRPDRLP